MSGFAVIVDLNGTLVDTEMAFFMAYKDALSRYDIPFTIETFTSHWSTQGKKLHDYLESIKRQDLLPNEEEILAEKDRIFQSTLEQRAIIMPNVKKVLVRFKEANIKLGLDSSSARNNINQLLDLFELADIFDAISSGDMELDEEKYGERKHKSSRMKALADMLGYAYDRCIVIGDAEKDIKGAKDAGMKSIAVPNQYTKGNDFSSADKVVDQATDITESLIEQLV